MISKIPIRPKAANTSKAIMSTGSFTSLLSILRLACLKDCDRGHLPL